jgi:hypothetical protein
MFRYWGGVRVSLFVCFAFLLASGSLFAFVGSILRDEGKKIEDERHFLSAYRVPTWEEYRIQYVMDHFLQSSTDYDVLFVGDSTCQYGYDPSLFQKLTGYTSFNAGFTVWLKLEGISLVLKRYLERHSNPKLVVLCIAPDTLYQTEDFAGYWERLKWAYGANPELDRPRHKNEFFYYVKEAIRLRESRLTQSESSLIEPSMDARRIVSMERGGFVERTGTYVGSAWIRDPNYPREIPAEVLTAFDNLIKMMIAKNIPLYIRVTPVRKSVNREPIEVALQSVDKLLELAPGTKFKKAVLSVSEDSMFLSDGAHLNSNGAASFTKEVADEIRSEMGKDI